MLLSPAKKQKRIILIITGSILLIVLSWVVFVNSYLEPLIRKRLSNLIIEGSDSLYNYKLDKLNVVFFGRKVEVENLQIKVDSSRYEYLLLKNALPSITMQLDLKKGEINGIGIFAMLMNKRINIREIISKDADIKLSRHVRNGTGENLDRPLWKSILPNINGIAVDKISLDGLKLLYKHADTSESTKLQFDRCDAVFENVRIDSASAHDSTRVGFAKEIAFNFTDMKFRTSDSSYKMKATGIRYSSEHRTLEIDSFKFQPTLKREVFYITTKKQETLYQVEFEKIKVVNADIDRFINQDHFSADSIGFTNPIISIYKDKTAPIEDVASRIGKYPHQILLNTGTRITVAHAGFTNGELSYGEKNMLTGAEGFIQIHSAILHAENLTNDSLAIRQNPISSVSLEGKLEGGSQASIAFRFYLDSLNGMFDAKGMIRKIQSGPLNKIASPLANVQLSFSEIPALEFDIRGEDQYAVSNVKMPYHNFSLTVKQADEKTGVPETNTKLTGFLNKWVLVPDNPMPGGVERMASGQKIYRVSSQSFFGLIWKSVFAGIQKIIMKS